MLDQMKAVREFHEARNIAHEVEGGMPTSTELVTMKQAGEAIATLAEMMEPRVEDDPRYLRAHLIAEECAELCEAMAAGDEVLALDALTDLLYVTVGTAVQFGWPLDKAFDEVHRSNMTKTGGGGDDPRVRDKGAAYEPPNLAGLLEDRS